MNKLLLFITFFTVLCFGMVANAATLGEFNQATYDSIQDPEMKEFYESITKETYQEFPFGSLLSTINLHFKPITTIIRDEYTLNCYHGKLGNASILAFKENQLVAFLIDGNRHTQDCIRSLAGLGETDEYATEISTNKRMWWSYKKEDQRKVYISWDPSSWGYIVGQSELECKSFISTLKQLAIEEENDR